MKNLQIQPDKIVVPGEYVLGNLSILKIYFRIFERGAGDALPPVITVRNTFIDQNERSERDREYMDFTLDMGMVLLPYTGGSMLREPAERNTGQIYETLERKKRQTTHYLIDGNHKTAAATLANKPINAIELETDDDLRDVRAMVESGELFGFERPEDCLHDLVYECESYILKNLECLMTVKERIDNLVEDQGLPKYMIDHFAR